MVVLNGNNKRSVQVTFNRTEKGVHIVKTARSEYIVKNFISHSKSEILFRSFDKKVVKDFYNSFLPKLTL